MDLSNTPSLQGKILVVDDHPHTAVLLARAIAKLSSKIEVTSATSGQEALELLQDRSVDILITDMDMPGMSGLELIEKLHEHPSNAPTYSYLLTASHVSGLKIAARHLDVTEVLRKPVHPEKICHLVLRALEEIDQFKLYKQIAVQKKFKILIADHEPDSVTLLLRYLESEGYICIFARDGIETLEQTRRESPDLILLESHIPPENGFKVLDEIRSDPSLQDVPVIVLSASWISVSEIRHRLSLGTEDFVSKPIDRVQLFTSIRRKLLMKETQYANTD